MFFLSSADFAQNRFFPKKFFKEYHQNVKQFGSNLSLAFCLILVQTVCKGYQQTMVADKSLRVHAFT